MRRHEDRRHLLNYGAAILVGAFAYVSLLYLNKWSPWFLPNLSLISAISSGALAFVRFLGGFGISLTYAAFCSLLLRKTAPWLRGKTRRTAFVKVLLAVLGFLVLTYAAFSLMTAFQGRAITDTFETLATLFGIWSLVSLVYIAPIVKNEYAPFLEEGRIAEMKGRFRNITHSLWRGYSYYLRKDYGSIYSSDFQVYGEELDNLRAMLSGILLLPISMLFVSITPLTALSVAVWRRMFTLQQSPFSRGERILLTIIALSIAIAASLFILMPVGPSPVVHLDLSYGLGMMTGILMLLVIAVRG